MRFREREFRERDRERVTSKEGEVLKISLGVVSEHANHVYLLTVMKVESWSEKGVFFLIIKFIVVTRLCLSILISLFSMFKEINFLFAFV